MPRGSPAQTVFPFGVQPDEVVRDDRQDVAVGWARTLGTAFADPDRHSGFLPQAEEAVRAQPGDGHILLLAATAALLDRDAARARVFLKRFSKRYVAIGTFHLLRALTLAQENKLASARSVLQAHGLTDRFNVLYIFPGGFGRRAWLSRQYDRIFERDKAGRHKRVASDAARKAKSRSWARRGTGACRSPQRKRRRRRLRSR